MELSFEHLSRFPGKKGMIEEMKQGLKDERYLGRRPSEIIQSETVSKATIRENFGR